MTFFWPRLIKKAFCSTRSIVLDCLRSRSSNSHRFTTLNFIKQVRRCAAYLRENKIDLVHTHCFYANIFGMAAATLAGVPVRVASKRETGKMRTAAQDFVEKLAFGRADAIVVNAAAVRDHLIQHSIEPEKIRVIYNGLDFSRFSNSDNDKLRTVESFRLPTDETIRFVTLVANLRHAVKNVPNLLRAAKIVTAKIPDTHFVIAGEGELESDLKSMASELGLNGNVHFIGRCTDVPALLDISDICVLTSTAEGFANSILEYMAAGKAVIATNVGGAAEAIVDGETGYLIPSGDDPALGSQVDRIARRRSQSREIWCRRQACRYRKIFTKRTTHGDY